MSAANALFGNTIVEDLGLLVDQRTCPDAFAGARVLRIEFNSRGDRVPGRIVVPQSTAPPFPIVLMQADAGQSMDSSSLDIAAPWVRAGAIVASIDLPLHGERSSPKFSERLLETLRAIRAGSDAVFRDVNGIALAIEFTRQSMHDYARTLDALASLKQFDISRVGFAGFGMGANLGALFCAGDDRLDTAALVAPGPGGPDPIDLLGSISQIDPRRLLIVEPEQAEPATKGAAKALLDAAGEACRRISCPGDGSEVSEAVAESVGDFLVRALGQTDDPS